MSEKLKQFDALLSDYWKAAYNEAAERRTHDDENGSAQKAYLALIEFVEVNLKQRTEPSRKIVYKGITYPVIFDNELSRRIWKKVLCPNGFHLWDEVSSLEGRTLTCDACDAIEYLE